MLMDFPLQEPSLGEGSNTFVDVEDFRIGSFVSIYGRPVFIKDADTFTKAWYRVRYVTTYFRLHCLCQASDLLK